MDKILYEWGKVFRGIKDDKYAWGVATFLIIGLMTTDSLLLFLSIEESAEWPGLERGGLTRILFFWHPPVSEPPEYGDWLLGGAALIFPFVFRFISAEYVRRLSPFVIGRLFRGALIILIVCVWMQLGLLFDGFGDWLFIASIFAILMIMYGKKETHGH